MKKEISLEQKLDRAEKLERVFHAIFFIFGVGIISFGILAFAFMKHFAKFMLLSMICGILMMFSGTAQFNFLRKAGEIRMQLIDERFVKFAKLHDSFRRDKHGKPNNPGTCEKS